MKSEFTILINTRNRYIKLLRTLDSLGHSSMLGVKVVVMFDGDRQGQELLKIDREQVLSLYASHCGSVAVRNKAMKFCEGSVLYATDDVVFPPLFINEMKAEFHSYFPFTDGVMGIRQEQDHHKSGVALIGRKFLRRYPDKQLFFPGYYHFAAQEVAAYADSVGRFRIANHTKPIFHYHPAFFSLLRFNR